MDNIFTGKDLMKAFDKGSEARFFDIIKYAKNADDPYEVYKFLYEYGELEGYDVEFISDKLGYY